MGLLAQIKEHRASLLRGLVFMIGGLALVLAGTTVGTGTTKTSWMVAGTLAAGGVTLAFMGFFLYVLPPLLPPK